jgi:hypothetical protein
MQLEGGGEVAAVVLADLGVVDLVARYAVQ